MAEMVGKRVLILLNKSGKWHLSLSLVKKGSSNWGKEEVLGKEQLKPNLRTMRKDNSKIVI